jgi:hypothetical protein
LLALMTPGKIPGNEQLSYGIPSIGEVCMDAIQFGRWVGTQRRKCGWPSQRRLVEEIRQNPFLGDVGISEDFLARLEAGQLAHPFRNSARQRVLTLAWYLCTSQADLRSYLRSAEIKNLNTEEREQLRRLSEHLKQIVQTAPPLPPRPKYVCGRDELIDRIGEALASMESGVCAITGMVGIGKTTLAYEVLHNLNNDHRHLRQLFHHGSATFSCAGRHGTSGLLSLLDEISAVYGSGAGKIQDERAGISLVDAPGAYPEEIALARAIQRTQQTLAQKSLLLLLDHVEADFPLREAMEALLSLNQPPGKVGGTPAFRHVLLITSRYIPAPTLINRHFHLQPLEHKGALELFSAVLGRPISAAEQEKSGQICAAVGYLPLAIEVAATAVAAKGIPLTLMAEQVTMHPLATILDSEHELQSKLAQSLCALDPEKRQQFVQLSMLGQQDFDLESVARIYERNDAEKAVAYQESSALRGSTGNASAGGVRNNVQVPSQQLASAAASLGIFVRHSLVELVSRPRNCRAVESLRYHLPPLLYAYARASREADCVEA